MMIWPIIFFVILVVAGVMMVDQSRSRTGRNVGFTLIGLGMFGFIAAILIGAAVVISTRAHARDADGRYANSPLKPWFDQLRSGKGLCCSDADGTALADVDWDAKDGHYRVRIAPSAEGYALREPTWIDVPDDAVITEPNRAGRTMVWPYYINGKPVIRCFMPGSMT